MPTKTDELSTWLEQVPNEDMDGMIRFIEDKFNLYDWREEENEAGVKRYVQVRLSENWTPEIEMMHKLLVISSAWQQKYCLKQKSLFDLMGA